MKILSKIENEELRAEIQKAVELEIENAKEVVLRPELEDIHQ